MVTYLDASAWVKRYVAEDGSQRVDALFRDDTGLACATVGFLETLTSLARASRAGRIDDLAYRQARLDAAADFGRFRTVDFTPEVFQIARGMTERFALHTGDIIHLATATVLRSAQREPVRFVTADRELGAAARLARFDVFDPTEN